MKKTLFAMAALALCGTAFAATYDTKTLTSTQLSSFDTPPNEAVTLNVNETVTFGEMHVNTMSNAFALNFVGGNTFSITGRVNFGCFGSKSITGDSTAATSWESKLLQDAGDAVAITLISYTGSREFDFVSNPTFMNASSWESITLGNTQLTYAGYWGHMPDLASSKAMLQDDQIALVHVEEGAEAGLYLVGKVAAPVPEPATATLSLMALAGLASRRRRK